MKIEHLAIWAEDLEILKSFYVNFFDASCSEQYHNAGKQFNSYFLSFDGACRLELMQMPSVVSRGTGNLVFTGLAHFAISTGSKESVDDMTEQLRLAGHVVEGEPRWTGDGYYESIVLDPEGNKVEITI